MHFTSLTSAIGLLLSATVASAGDAPIVAGNLDATYQAIMTLDVKSGIAGILTAGPTDDHVGVFVTVQFSGLRPGSSYMYHIHNEPVPSDGDCLGTMHLLDPYKTTVDPCPSLEPQTCGVGDLSGKHGLAPSDDNGNFQAVYVEKYMSNQPDTLAFFGNRSVTIHSSDGTRLNCGSWFLTSS